MLILYCLAGVVCSKGNAIAKYYISVTIYFCVLFSVHKRLFIHIGIHFSANQTHLPFAVHLFTSTRNVYSNTLHHMLEHYHTSASFLCLLCKCCLQGYFIYTSDKLTSLALSDHANLVCTQRVKSLMAKWLQQGSQ